MTKQTSPVRRLYCSCCGEDAGRWNQHWNLEYGIGYCVRCVTSLRIRGESERDIRMMIGAEGFSWGMSIAVYGLAFRVVAAFGVHDEARANAWMLQHETHALLAIHEGLLLLADIADRGVEPVASTPAGTPAPAGNLRIFPTPRALELNRENNAVSAGSDPNILTEHKGAE